MQTTPKAGVQFVAPDLGTPYVLAANNEGGKKYKTDAFTFTAITGKFTSAAAPTGGNGGGGGGGGGSAGGPNSDQPADESALYYGDANTTGLYVTTANQNGDTEIDLGASPYPLSETKTLYLGNPAAPNVPDFPALNSIALSDGFGELSSYDHPVSNYKFYDKDGNALTGLDSSVNTADTSVFIRFGTGQNAADNQYKPQYTKGFFNVWSAILFSQNVSAADARRIERRRLCDLRH